ncbi:hypothetical protein OAF39_00200 [Akkermansiaceae bacterium]|nr:hypothetical protein [Akkermansiaceae bacterium]
MEKFLSATMLMPLLINQEFAEQLIDRFLKASDHQKQKIIEDASELNQKPIVQEFHFPTKATKTKNKLRHFKGYATATETVLGKAGFIKKEVEMEMSLIEDIEEDSSSSSSVMRTAVISWLVKSRQSFEVRAYSPRWLGV